MSITKALRKLRALFQNNILTNKKKCCKVITPIN
nr:MAG TPA: hypothetical protein [Caudoviricetes sp.]